MVLRCPAKKIKISSYIKKSGIRVKAHCTPDKGAHGRTPKSKRVLPKLKKDEFEKYGYSTKLPHKKRVAILKRACRELSYASVLKRVVVLRSYNKRNIKIFKKFDKDIHALQKWRASKKKRKSVKKSVKKSIKK